MPPETICIRKRDPTAVFSAQPDYGRPPRPRLRSRILRPSLLPHRRRSSRARFGSGPIGCVVPPGEPPFGPGTRGAGRRRLSEPRLRRIDWRCSGSGVHGSLALLVGRRAQTRGGRSSGVICFQSCVRGLESHGLHISAVLARLPRSAALTALPGTGGSGGPVPVADAPDINACVPLDDRNSSSNSGSIPYTDLVIRRPSRRQSVSSKLARRGKFL